jgi:predicted metal-dependent enzyme (double-stranded beta helix superfamily)
MDPKLIADVKSLLGPVRLNRKEWMRYTKFRDRRYTRTLVGWDPNFMILLLSWEKGQMSPIHDHAGRPFGCFLVG